MGASYSQTTVKTQLKMSVQRLMMHRNKMSNQVSVDSKAIALLLQAGKDESARIKCEALLASKNLCMAMELLQLMAELLSARTALITASKEPQADLEEAMASIIFCSTRLEVPELAVLAQQFGAKFGKDWALRHAHNESRRVNPRIISKLSIQPPPLELIISTLREIAATYGVEWEPDMSTLETGILDHSNPERLGSIARSPVSSEIAGVPSAASASPAANGTQQKPGQFPSSLSNPPQSMGVSAASAASAGQYPVANPHAAAPFMDSAPGTLSPYPGTLNLVVHRGRNILNLASQSEPHDLFVRITNTNTGVKWASEADAQGGANPVYANNPVMENAVHHYPFSVGDATHQFLIEVLQKNKGTFNLKDDKLIGSATFYADNLRANPQQQWYGLYLNSMQVGFLLMSSQYLPLNASVVNQDELQQQRVWQEQQQQQQQMQPAAPGGPTQDPAAAVAAASAAYRHQNRNSIGDRVRGLFQAPPDSPTHDYNRNLASLMAQSAGVPSSTTPEPTYAAYSSQSTRTGAPLPDQSYHALGDAEPGGTAGKQDFKENSEAAPSALNQPLSSPLLSKPAAAAAAASADDDGDVALDFPDVPKHDAGAGRPPSNSGGSSGGGTVYATRPAPAPKKKLTADEEMEERLKRLQ